MSALGDLRQEIEAEKQRAVSGIGACLAPLREMLAAKEQALTSSVERVAEAKLRAISQQQEQVARRLHAATNVGGYNGPPDTTPLKPCTSASFMCLPDVGAAQAGLQALGDEALEFYTLALERDEAEAHHWLGCQYQTGEGVQKDLAEAFRQFEAAASAGSLNAQFSLACRYINGEGTTKDLDKGIALLRAAAEAGHPDAENALATRHFTVCSLLSLYLRNSVWRVWRVAESKFCAFVCAGKWRKARRSTGSQVFPLSRRSWAACRGVQPRDLLLQWRRRPPRLRTSGKLLPPGRRRRPPQSAAALSGAL